MLEIHKDQVSKKFSNAIEAYNHSIRVLLPIRLLGEDGKPTAGSFTNQKDRSEQKIPESGETTIIIPLADKDLAHKFYQAFANDASQEGGIFILNKRELEELIESISSLFTLERGGDVPDVYNSNQRDFVISHTRVGGYEGVYEKRSSAIKVLKVCSKEEVCFIGDVETEEGRQYSKGDFYVVEGQDWKTQAKTYRLLQADYAEKNLRDDEGNLIYERVPVVDASEFSVDFKGEDLDPGMSPTSAAAAQKVYLAVTQL